MKKIVLTIAMFVFITSLFAQEKVEETKKEAPKAWKYFANAGLNLSQTSFSNWALGGEGSVGGVAIFDLAANYKEGKNSWDNSFKAQYGLQKIDGESAKKSIDIFEFNSKYGYQIGKNWSLAALLGLKSQFSAGYNYVSDTQKDKISGLFAPGYVTTALGFDYKPNNWFSLFMSPITGKHTFVMDDDLSKVGAFGVKAGDKYRAELGALLNASLQREIMKNVNLTTALGLFSAYDSFGNVDISWDLSLGMKVNDYISATISTSLLYDDDIDYIDEKGMNKGPKIQFKEVIGVGFAYTFTK